MFDPLAPQRQLVYPLQSKVSGANKEDELYGKLQLTGPHHIDAQSCLIITTSKEANTITIPIL